MPETASSTPNLWIVERCDSEKFPYRVQIVRRGEPWFTLRTQDRWPTPNRNIFCLREQEAPEPDEVLEEVERVPSPTSSRFRAVLRWLRDGLV